MEAGIGDIVQVSEASDFVAFLGDGQVKGSRDFAKSALLALPTAGGRKTWLQTIRAKIRKNKRPTFVCRMRDL
ncbi:MAG: hypothetical protein WDO18_03820 [Acidobacteriota bacterium]